ncbi:hypothetical protein [Aquabacterium sp.]|uniref:hypothetical protein n=1 Tax=Aquabacterium sp. TaxID=1872578 RepID=UPI002B9D7ABB|nr:hypothetical protein [Aquabacterium sp.]HSW05254.1 hypothetical protein [Aquabacterium sp.]
MTFEIAAAAALGPASSASAGAAPVQVGYGVSLSDIGGFQQALSGAQARLEARPVGAPSEAVKQLMTPFEHINNEASRLSLDANAAQRAGRDMSPSEVVMLTVRCQEFMFHCQLTSNIANRTSDGLQQLFRQQA